MFYLQELHIVQQALPKSLALQPPQLIQRFYVGLLIKIIYSMQKKLPCFTENSIKIIKKFANNNDCKLNADVML